MTTPELHPWLSTPEASAAARKAIQIPLSLLPKLAVIVGADELASEALAILTECALPPREVQRPLCATCLGSLDRVRAGAKFCSPNCRSRYGMRVVRSKAETLPPRTGAHIGSMHDWPEAEMSKYAIRTIGYVLNNYLRTRGHAVETPATDAMANMMLAVEEPEETARDIMERYLESKGVRVSGDEEFAELAEAALHVRGETRRHEPVRLAA